eukprot:TRINITY_DN12672_c0_g2_i7.p1 TRINITY_DN12672_c0_g2~~TRINITY_DN12672_c0_g2_i7.p1  ORF type:complete len:572 (-),score=107.99 TRINITY_DN12672_c0_g2_i7:59-1774(-)
MKYWGRLVIGNICLLLTSLTQIAIPWYCGQILNEITIGRSEERLNKLAFEFVAIIVVNAVTALIRAYSYNIVGEFVMIDLRKELFRSIMQKDIEFFDQRKTGELMSRLSADTATIQNSATTSISVISRNVLQLIGSVIVIFLISWKLSLLLLAMVPILAGLTIFASSFGRKFSKDYQDALAEGSIVAEEAISNIRTVKTFSSEELESLNYETKMKRNADLGQKKSFLWGGFQGMIALIANGGLVVVLYFGGKMVLNGEMTTGDMGSFIIYAVTIGISSAASAAVFGEVVTSLAACERVFEILDYRAKIPCSGGQRLDTFKGEVSLRNVEFRYPTKKDVTVLKSLDMTIRQGEVVAIVGSSGSGKSSIINIIERLYDVDSGDILFDGVSLKTLDLNWLHKNIGYVAQEPTLFSGTIEENIAYGLSGYTKDELDLAAKLANAFDFIHNKEQFPKGYETVVGEKGIKLSGGQKQRVAIARALIKRPKILIFDEATSALDAESEYLVQSAIDTIIQNTNTTVIIIAHRLSTIINCGRILVMSNGRIVEEGKHQELVAMNGVYKALIERQLSGYNN